MIFWNKLALFLVGSMFGFLIGEMVFYRPLYKFYKEKFTEYADRWAKLNMHSLVALYYMKINKYDKAKEELDCYLKESEK